MLSEPYSPSALDGRDAAIDLGTTTRRFKDLHLSGNVYANALRHDGDYNTYVAFLPDRIYMDRGGNRAFDADSGSTRFGRPDGSEAMRIDSSGNVGIGTSSPDTLLNIASESAPTFRIENTDTTLSAGQVVGALEFFSSDPSGKGPNVTGYIETRAADAVGAGGEMVFATGATGGSPEGERAIERMRIDSSGNVGIGTSSPSVPVHVYKSQASPTIVARFENPADEAIVEIKSKNTDLGVLQFADTEDVNVGAVQYSHSDNSMRFKTNDSERMRIDSSGNVGIGGAPAAVTHSPHLDLVGNRGTLTVGTGYFEDNGTTNFIGGARSLAFGAGGSAERMRITSSGNVGIGTSSPACHLDVKGSGNGSVSDQLRITSTDTDSKLAFVNTTGSGAIVQSGYAMLFMTNTANTERMRIDPSGNLLVGKTSADNTTAGCRMRGDGFASFVRSGAEPVLINRLTNDGSLLTLQKGGTTVGSIGSGVGDSSASTLYIADAGNVGIRFDQAATDDIQPCTSTGADRDNAINLGSSDNRFKDLHLSGTAHVATDGVLSETAEAGSTFYFSNNNIGLKAYSYISSNRLIPCDENGANRDNYVDLGQSNARFNDIYATNGTIQTSDRNEKQDIAELSDAEQRVAVACKGLLRKFRWKSAAEEKGDEARIHFGIIAQDLQAAFAAEGLDAGDYGMFISTTWTDEETNEEKTRLGVRYSELLAFIISAL